MTSSWSEDGYFIPFPKPIDAITTNPLSSQDWGLCLHDDWLPAIQGALRVLARRETWKGDPADVQTCVENARLILAHLGDPCSTDYPSIACCYDFQGEEDRLGWSPTTDGGVPQAGWVGAGWSAVYNAFEDKYILSIDIPVPVTSTVESISVRYTSIEEIEVMGSQVGNHFMGLGFGTPAPAGVDLFSEVAAINPGVGFLQVTIYSSALSSFVIYEACCTLRNAAAECP